MKVLMIGNSFSQSVLTYLPKIVEREAKHSLLLAQMMIGGCSLERHIDELAKAEKDSSYKPYWTNYQNREHVALPEMITAEKWDIVTIQQASHFSWDMNMTEPFAGQLISYIRANAPQAEIVIQKTWSYRPVDISVGGTVKRWGFTTDSMYEKLSENYADWSRRYGFRLITTGDAVQIFRRNTPVKYTPPNLDEINSFKCPDLPRIAGEVVGKYCWCKNSETGEMELIADDIHLNDAGEYLQACVWYGFLFGENPADIGFEPDTIGKSTSDLLRSCAAESLCR